MIIKDIIVNDVYNTFDNEIEIEDIIIEQPKLKTNGDYSIPCFSLAKKLHKSPIEIAKNIELKIDKKNYKKIEVVSGYLNVFISDELINKKIRRMDEDKYFDIKRPDIIEKYFLDYGGPNVAKPLHVGHMRTAIVGESIKRLIEFVGHKTISDVHLGDYGLQIGEVIYGMIRDNVSIDDLDINYLDKIYPEMNKICKENEKIKNECEEIIKKLQDNDPLYIPYFNKIREVSIPDIKKNYDYLNVNFDLWLGESDSRETISTVEKIFQSKNLLKISEGALIVEVASNNDKKETPPLLFKKSNGGYLYASTDIATIYDRVTKYNPDHILYIVDNRQELHFTQVFRAVDKANIIDINKLEFLGYGTVNGSDGKPYKTRNGDSPKLANLFKSTKDIFILKREENKLMSDSDLNKIVNSILKFADLSNSREKDYIFDLSKFSDVTGKTGPYILYTYLRINKIIKKCNIKEFNDIIYNDTDRDLRIKLMELDSIINISFIERKPHYIADYLYDLCVLANIFYQKNHILDLEDENNKQNWIFLLNLTNKIIKQLLYILVIDIPTVM